MVQHFFIRGFAVAGIILLFPAIYAQDHNVKNYTRELNIKFTSSELKTIDKGVELLKEADKKLNAAQKMYEDLTDLEKKEGLSDGYVKAFSSLIEASDLYYQGHMLIYDMFKTKCEEFWITMRKVQHYAAGVEKGKYYEGQARKNLAVARQRREQASVNEKFKYALLKLKEAYELEETTIRDQGRALQVYVDYPVEYNYGWDNDITLEEITELFRNPAIKEPPEDIFATVDTTIVVEPKLMGEIIFKVQIAAHTVPLTEEYLRTIYKGSMKIDMIYEEEWYKYSIGRFKTFEEANKTLEECKVRKAFIVAYQGKKKLTIKEAAALLGMQNQYQ